MAESLAAVSVVANVVQLIEFGCEVLARLSEFLSNPGCVQKTFRHLHTELRDLLDALEHTQTAIKTSSIRAASREALRPAIDSCRTQIETLDAIIGKTQPKLGDS